MGQLFLKQSLSFCSEMRIILPLCFPYAFIAFLQMYPLEIHVSLLLLWDLIHQQYILSLKLNVFFSPGYFPFFYSQFRLAFISGINCSIGSVWALESERPGLHLSHLLGWGNLSTFLPVTNMFSILSLSP